MLTKTPPESVTSPTRSRSRARVGDVDHETDDGPVEADGDEVGGDPGGDVVHDRADHRRAGDRAEVVGHRERVAARCVDGPPGGGLRARSRPGRRTRCGGRRRPATRRRRTGGPCWTWGRRPGRSRAGARADPAFVVAGGASRSGAPATHAMPAARRWERAIRQGLRTPASPPGSGDVARGGPARRSAGVVGEQELAAPDRAVVAVARCRRRRRRAPGGQPGCRARPCVDATWAWWCCTSGGPAGRRRGCGPRRRSGTPGARRRPAPRARRR